MGDLISREFLQTAIHNFFNGLNHTPTEEDIQRYIEVAPSAESKGEWIPVSERLPKEGETVLVCYQTQGGIAQSVCEWFDMPNRGIVWSTLGGRNPIAWQPLPEPYKGGEV